MPTSYVCLPFSGSLFMSAPYFSLCFSFSICLLLSFSTSVFLPFLYFCCPSCILSHAPSCFKVLFLSLSLYLLSQSQSLLLFFLSCHSHPWSPLTAPQGGPTAEPGRPREPRRAKMQSVAELGLFSVDLVLTLLILTSPRHPLESPASGLCRRAPPSTAGARNPLSAHARHIPWSLPSPHDPRGLSWPGVNGSRSDPGGPNTARGAESWAWPGGKTPPLFLPWYLTFKSLPYFFFL